MLRGVITISSLLVALPGHAILNGFPIVSLPAVAESTVAILIEDKKTRGPDGRPGFYPTSGVLITRDWVLTVRHGFAKYRGKRYIPRLRFGPSDKAETASVPIPADHIFTHPVLDLALVRVEGWRPPFSFRPARLGPPPPMHDKVLLAGFGQTKDSPPGAILSAVEEPVSAPAVVDSPRLPELFPPQLAAHYMEIDQRDGKGSCSGDSGGPVFRRLEDQLELVGIIAGNASFDGRHPCLEYSYAVRIDAAVDWIAAVTGKSFNLLTRSFQD